MYLKKLRIKGFRCIDDLTLNLHKGINVLIGENDTGKTTIIDALRICLGLVVEKRDVWVTPDDFHIDITGAISKVIEFHLYFGGLSPREQGVFVEMLAVTGIRSELQLHVRFVYDLTKDRIRREYWGGEKEGQGIPTEVLELMHYTHLDALRDASRDLMPRRGSQLSKLFLKLVPADEVRREYEREVNDKVQSIPILNCLLRDGEKRINEHLKKVALRNSTQTVEISLVEKEFRDIIEDLKLQVLQQGCNKKENPVLNNNVNIFKIWQNGLGLNNIIYIATVLGDLLEKRIREPDSFISLLIEEPEAHLHPQLQNVLFAYLEEIKDRDIQIFVTSHSPTITAKTDLDSVIVLAKDGGLIAATPLRKIQLTDRHKAYLRRFIDVTKSQLFFAKAVILVEGISEALLLPIFANLMGSHYNLERSSVEIVNVNGLAFEPFAKLFNSREKKKRLNWRCAILTDDDSKLGENISSRAQKVKELKCGLVRIFLSRVTLEFELYLHNEELVRKVYSELHPRTDFNFEGDIDKRARDFAKKIKSNNDKAIFAQNLAQKIDEEEEFLSFRVPPYVGHAIKWVIGKDARIDC